jgi:hypothetical protein
MRTHTQGRVTKADKLTSPESLRYWRGRLTKDQRRVVKKFHHKKQRQWDRRQSVVEELA